MYGIGVVDQASHEGVPKLVVSDEAPLVLGQDLRPALEPRSHPVYGLLELGHAHALPTAAGGQQGALVDDVCELGP